LTGCHCCYRFKLIKAIGAEEQVAPESEPQQPAQQPRSDECSRPPVTRQPHRPGEPDALGLDINADRKGHGRHLRDPAYFPIPEAPPAGSFVRNRPATAGARAGRREDDGVGSRRRQALPGSDGGDEVKLRKSPERKQVPQQTHQLAYHASEAAGARGSSRNSFSRPAARAHAPSAVGDAAGCAIGAGAEEQNDLYRPMIAGKQGLFQPGAVAQPQSVDTVREAVFPDNKARPGRRKVSVADGGVSVEKQQPAEEDYRPFEQRQERRRPGTAGAGRSRQALIYDPNEARKEQLWAKWEAGALALPSMAQPPPSKQRPQTAGPQSAVAISQDAGARPRRVREEPAQYVDIMDSAVRGIADKHRRPAHRRLKSDVTHPGYQIPPPAAPTRSDERVVVPAPGVPPAACRPQDSGAGQPRHRSALQLHQLAPSEDLSPSEDEQEEGSPVKYPRGAASKEQYERERGAQARHRDLKLRGAGHHAHGELLPEELRLCKDSAFRLLNGK
jgi:hypothetical protein